MGRSRRNRLPFELKLGDQLLSFITTTTVFGAPADVTLSELAVEAFFQRGNCCGHAGDGEEAAELDYWLAHRMRAIQARSPRTSSRGG